MAYRILVVLFAAGFAAFLACGDDGGGNTTKMDASTTPGDSSSGSDIDAPLIDAPGTTTDAGVGAVCGTTTCTSTQECCLMMGSGGMCVTAGTCSGVGFECDGPEDCGSTEVCCYGNQGSGSAGTGGSECQLTAQCQINACHVDTDCMGATSKCCSVASSQYKVCLAQCPP
jgi:hypothetical protein